MSNKDFENDLDDKANWPKPIEGYFISMLYEETKKGLQTNTLEKNQWDAIDMKLFDKYGKRYTREKLKQKYNRLRKIHRKFAKLVNHTGMGWDPVANTVQASDEVWAAYIKIFNNTTATGQMQYASTNSPPNSDSERELEAGFLTTDAHIKQSTGSGSRAFSEGHEGTSTKRCALFPPSDLSSKSKSSKSTKMDEAIAAWAKSLNAKTDATLEKVKRKREREVSSPLRKLSTIEDCMEVLKGMEDIDDTAYLKALEKFTSSDWRRMFMKMSESRKKLWLNSLK
ncbi:L10-interacting MYB domain-containing protein [Pyrus x bretschneideri]|uniref:L10-interacting MYB domain-containing protein n=1 Tax=Pyrus x bretschneideri TaxID=225117 RepID=UPI0020303D5F|nr:L10-interacting MYB domain-containing protein [Pyrus x bretschneideri]XP_048426387.1 L10-interacting MYB domain-containing protein [Pyrus x bretschneideri]